MNNISFKEQLDALHTALFGWPTDDLTPMAELERCTDIRQAAILLMNSSRFRWDNRDKVPLFGEDKWVCAEYKDLRIWVNLRDSEVSFGILHNDWEVREADFMMNHLKPGDTMLDIGANLGVYSLQAAKVVGGSGRVHAFEPNPVVCPMLRRSVRENNFDEICLVYDVGLADMDTIGSVHSLEGTHNLGGTYVSKAPNSGTPVTLRRLDSYRFERPISFVKIDVEGYECQVLDGGIDTFRRHRPLVLAELFPSGLRASGGTSAVELIQRWTTLGYRVEEFEHGRHGKTITTVNIADYDEMVHPINVLCIPP